MTVKIIVITPERVVWNTVAEKVVLPGLEGQVGILANHAPLITALDIGVVKLTASDTKKALIVFGGFAEIEDNEITVLVNDVEEIFNIDLPAAREALNLSMAKIDQIENSKEKMLALQNMKKNLARVQAMNFL